MTPLIWLAGYPQIRLDGLLAAAASPRPSSRQAGNWSSDQAPEKKEIRTIEGIL